MYLQRLGIKSSSNKTLLLDNMGLKNPFRTLNWNLIIQRLFNSQDKGKKTLAYPEVETRWQRPKTLYLWLTRYYFESRTSDCHPFLVSSLDSKSKLLFLCLWFSTNFCVWWRMDYLICCTNNELSFMKIKIKRKIKFKS